MIDSAVPACMLHVLDFILWRGLSQLLFPFAHPPISLRLLALILCSNCSSVVNTALATIGGHLLTYFLSLGGPLELAQCPPHVVMAFHAPP